MCVCCFFSLVNCVDDFDVCESVFQSCKLRFDVCCLLQEVCKYVMELITTCVAHCQFLLFVSSFFLFFVLFYRWF